MALVKNKKYFKDLANKAEKEYNLPNNLLVNLLQAESSYDPDIISGKKKSSAGAVGIAQFMPATAKEYGIDPTNPEQSIEAAAKYLKKSYAIFGNWEDSVRSYNTGIENVKAWKKGKKGLAQETINYTNKIFRNNNITNQEIQPPTGIEITEPKVPNIYTDVTNFGMTPQINTFVTQTQEDNSQQEENKTEEEKVVEQKTNELNLIKDLYQGKIQQPQFKEEPQQQELPQLDVMQHYAEISNLLDQAREGGFFEGWAFNTMQQGGEIRESTLPNPINGIVREKYGRTKYDSRLDRIILTPSSDFANEQDVINHEKFHKLQFDQGRSNFDIAHQTENELWAKMQKRPSVTDTDEEYYKFHNRKGKEIAIDLSNLKESYPIMQFIPDDILYSNIIDTSQYYNPYSMEGEAQYYEDSFKKQQGGEIKTTPYGQWEFPGEITKIPSNRITMKDVPQALLGISNTGEKRIMLPEEEHTFKNATEVTEVPLSFKELYKLKTGKDLR